MTARKPKLQSFSGKASDCIAYLGMHLGDKAPFSAARAIGHSLLPTLLYLSTIAVWGVATWRLYRADHFLIASALLFVTLRQSALYPSSSQKQQATRPATNSFPRRRCVMPRHNLGAPLIDNEFNERVSVPLSPTLHTRRHKDRAEKHCKN